MKPLPILKNFHGTIPDNLFPKQGKKSMGRREYQEVGISHFVIPRKNFYKFNYRLSETTPGKTLVNQGKIFGRVKTVKL